MQNLLLRKAKSDLKVAVLTLNSGDEYDIQLAAYHIQQAVEKVLKGVVSFYGKDYTKTHEIASLLRQLPEEQELISSNLLADIERNEALLSKWERVTRYDDPYLASRRLIQELLGLAQALYTEVESTIEKQGDTTISPSISVHKMNLFDK